MKRNSSGWLGYQLTETGVLVLRRHPGEKVPAGPLREDLRGPSQRLLTTLLSPAGRGRRFRSVPRNEKLHEPKSPRTFSHSFLLALIYGLSIRRPLGGETGSRTVNFEPSPGLESTSIVPPWS